jgi:hypothetical protein
MNKIATKAAYESATSRIQPTQVVTNWSSDGTELTINPNFDLIIAGGADPATVIATPYEYQITNVGTDLAGNALTSSSFSFKTRRQITQNLPGIDGLSGDIREDKALSRDYYTGDSAATANAQYKGFFSFDIFNIPDNVISFEFANLSIYQVKTFKDSLVGDPYADLGGSVNLEHVNFLTWTDLAFSTPTIRAIGPISNNSTIEYKTLSVLSAVQDDYAQRIVRKNRTQFRTVFPTKSDFDLKLDDAVFASVVAATNPSYLQVRYFVP